MLNMSMHPPTHHLLPAYLNPYNSLFFQSTHCRIQLVLVFAYFCMQKIYLQQLVYMHTIRGIQIDTQIIFLSNNSSSNNGNKKSTSQVGRQQVGHLDTMNIIQEDKTVVCICICIYMYLYYTTIYIKRENTSEIRQLRHFI